MSKGLHHATLDKRLRELGFKKHHDYYGATPHYLWLFELNRSSYGTEEKKDRSSYWSNAVIRVDIYSWYRQGTTINGVGLTQENHRTGDQPDWHHSKDVSGLTGGYKGLNGWQFAKLMEKLNEVYALQKEIQGDE